jgi:hypothetical protein
MRASNSAEFDWPFVISVPEDIWNADEMISWLKSRGTFDEDWSFKFEVDTVNWLFENTLIGFATQELAAEFLLTFD